MYARLLGLTEGLRYELSDLIEEEMEVTERHQGHSHAGELHAYGPGWQKGMDNLGRSGYYVTFGDSLHVGSFTLFKNFSEGDNAVVKYKKIFGCVTDYVPPNYDEKKVIKRVLMGYEFWGAEKK